MTHKWLAVVRMANRRNVTKIGDRVLFGHVVQLMYHRQIAQAKTIQKPPHYVICLPRHGQLVVVDVGILQT